MMRTHQGGADRAHTPSNDVVALKNEQVVYVPDKNYRNHLREAKHHRDLLKHYYNLWHRQFPGGPSQSPDTELWRDHEISNKFDILLIYRHRPGNCN